MSIPGFSPFPPIPQRSTPEADFDAKMYALFQHFATTHRNELLAFIEFLETNSTVIDAALDGTTIGLTDPAAAKFTDLEVAGTPGVLARFRDGVASNFYVQTTGNKTTIGNAAGSSRLALMAGNQEAIEFDSAGRASGAAVQASGNDATPGKLMKVPAFGLGEVTQPSLVGDVFQYNATGTYYARPASSSGAADTPYQGNFHTWKSQRDQDFQAALLIAQESGAPRAYIGTRHGSLQGPWGRLLHSENVVGPVSQNAGKVTGAVVQSGSGPGGHFRRFADGTQECWVVSPELVADTLVGSRYISADGWEWDFPAEFISTPTVHATARRWTGAHAHGAMIGSGSFGVNGCRLLLSTEFEGNSGFLHGYAIGRWY
jgi:hypothetical protein